MMAANWRARLPRQNPADGMMHVVIAAKSSTGDRVEVDDEMSEKKARMILKLALMTDDAIEKICKES
jgi:hypothetical protein